jgi:uncharacterized protein YbjT (DUF2867 family)
VEEHVAYLGLGYTILRPVHFMEVWLGPVGGYDIPAARARVFGAGDKRVSWISLGDVAEFAVRSLENPGARDRFIEIGGPEPLTPVEVIRIFEEESGRPFEVEHVPVEALRQQAATATDPYDVTFAGLMLGTATLEFAVDMKETARTFGISLTSVRDYARRLLVPAGG